MYNAQVTGEDLEQMAGTMKNMLLNMRDQAYYRMWLKWESFAGASTDAQIATALGGNWTAEKVSYLRALMGYGDDIHKLLTNQAVSTLDRMYTINKW